MKEETGYVRSIAVTLTEAIWAQAGCPSLESRTDQCDTGFQKGKEKSNTIYMDSYHAFTKAHVHSMSDRERSSHHSGNRH